VESLQIVGRGGIKNFTIQFASTGLLKEDLKRDKECMRSQGGKENQIVKAKVSLLIVLILAF